VKIYDHYDNACLLRLMSADDKEAFTELYNRFWEKLFAMAYNRLADIQDAEDIVHDVMAGLWSSRKHLDIQLLENYLATAIKYGVYHKIRKKEKARITQLQHQHDNLWEMPVEDAVHYKRILEIIKTEVEHLPEKCRLIFKYSRDEGKSVKQIAAALNISPKTVENQLNKALKHLKLVTRSFFFLFFL
jgi:RNA polymerase sigma-70 factor (family 1)